MADISAVTGSAYGFFATVGLFGGPPATRGPAPTVTLPAAGSATPVAATDPSGAAVYGPAHIFESGPETVRTIGSPGPIGSVTSSTSIAGCATKIDNSCDAGQVYAGPFTASSATSTCTASEAGVTGSASLVNGQVVTSTDALGNAVTTQPVPANPKPNYVVTGTINTTGINGGFKWVFNEQTMNPDGSLTVSAGHEYLGFSGSGPAKGDLVFGQVTCGVTVVASSTTTASPTSTTAQTGSSTTSTISGTSGSTTTTSTPAPTSTTSTSAATTTTTGATTTTTAPTTTTNPPATTTTTGAPQLGGSAFGYYTSVGLFGGPQAVRGPTPKVTLPPGGSTTPITASVASGDASYGPARIFTSGAIQISTEGSAASGSVTSSTHIQNVQPGQFSADLVTSSCTASQAGVIGSVSFTNAKMVNSTDSNGDPATSVQVPANPPPNYTLFGTINNVGGSFKFVFNEQVVVPNGSITVSAGHEYLGGGPNNAGPAKGDMIFGQSVCARTAAVLSTSGGGQTASGTTSASALATTGSDEARLLEVAMMLLITGWVAKRRPNPRTNTYYTTESSTDPT